MKRHIPYRTIGIATLCMAALPLWAQVPEETMTWRTTGETNTSTGDYAPLWFTANQYGLSSEKPTSAYLRAGTTYLRTFKKGWQVEVGLDLAVAGRQASTFVVQQAYADVRWKKLSLSVGSKERTYFPLEKDPLLSNGMMVEGSNTRPIPQVRLQMDDYLNVPFTRHWLGVKGHIAYGLYTDSKWQEDFVATGQLYNKNVLYHSKSLMLRVGNKEKFPVELEVGIVDASQFAGKQFRKEKDGSSTLVQDFPGGMKSLFKAFIPRHESTLGNVTGNHCGSWNFSLTGYLGKGWKIKAYLEHYFEDHSQMFFQYGPWKDGSPGVELTLPKNKWLSAVLWEGVFTKDQTGPILYDHVGGSFTDVQLSGGDNYFNNFQYLGWQHWGNSSSSAFIYGPQYNKDGWNGIKSSRIKAHHIGLRGNPSDEWNWRILLSNVRTWGSYNTPLDKVRHQFSSLYEATYSPRKFQGWKFSAALGLDRGNYLGNSAGVMVKVMKSGVLFKKTRK